MNNEAERLGFYLNLVGFKVQNFVRRVVDIGWFYLNLVGFKVMATLGGIVMDVVLSELSGF